MERYKKETRSEPRHGNQWLAAIEDLKAEGLEDMPVPSNGEVSYRFPQEREMT
jgi:Mn-containing catalase